MQHLLHAMCMVLGACAFGGEKNVTWSKLASRPPASAPGPVSDTPRWTNGLGYTCAQYKSEHWCANGSFVAGEEWAGKAGFYDSERCSSWFGDCAMTFKYPGHNCVVCGKTAPASSPVAPVRDTPGWNNGAGFNCTQYESRGWCAHGSFVKGMEWTGKRGFRDQRCAGFVDCGEKYRYPSDNCLVCGKSESSSIPDTPGWSNGDGYNCAQYESNLWCSNGTFVKGKEWTGQRGFHDSHCTGFADCGERYNYPGDNCVVCGKTTRHWYEGIDSVMVFGPQDDAGHHLDLLEQHMWAGQFSSERHAVLLKRGNYGDMNFKLGYYTSVAGVGASRNDVRVGSISVSETAVGGNTQTFWRSVEGLTTTNALWATSQGCAMRRMNVLGNLALSSAYSSGGFLADVFVNGQLQCGTQQQYFFRNSHFGSVACGGGMPPNYVFVGVDGAPGTDDHHTNIPTTPIEYEKPYIMEDKGSWSIVVPPKLRNTHGPQYYSTAISIPLSEVYVAKEGDTAVTINTEIRGKAGLLLTPAVYALSEAIVITQDYFVVLGLGYATLVATGGNSALIVKGSGVMVASVLFEAGSTKGIPTSPLLAWKGSNGAGFDIFSRVGSFKYRGCPIVEADVMVQIDGNSTVIDNSWNWHADHDDCGKSDQCFSGDGFKVTGSDVITYGLACEHTMRNNLHWQGENGYVYFYQNELPYHYDNATIAGYRADFSLKRHTAYGLGVYIIGHIPTVHAAFLVPPQAQMQNMYTWVIGGSSEHFHHTLCTDDSYHHCHQGYCSGGNFPVCWLPTAQHATGTLRAATIIV